MISIQYILMRKLSELYFVAQKLAKITYYLIDKIASLTRKLAKNEKHI